MKFFHFSFFLVLPLTVMAGDREIRTSPFDRAIPQVAFGGGWQTAINILNMDAAEVNFRILFRTPAGEAWAVPLAGRGSAAQFDIRLRRGESVTLTTEDQGGLQEGWARLEVDCCFALGGFSVFRQRVAGRPDFEAVVPFSRPAASSFLLYDNSAGFVTGVAVANGLPTVNGNLFVRIRDEAGNLLGTRDLQLPRDGRIVGALTQLLPETANRKGSLEISSTGSFAVLGLRFNPGGAFTSFNSFEPN
jgi:hypothetical protein